MNWEYVNSLALNWVDWAIVVVLTLSTVLSLWRGFVREALSLAAWVLAFIVASLFAEPLAQALAGWIENVTGRYIAAYSLLFVGVLVLGNLLNYFMSRLVKLSGLSLLDRLLGMAFGFTRGLIVVLVVHFVARELLPAQSQQALLESEIMPHLEILAHWLRANATALNDSWQSGISV